VAPKFANFDREILAGNNDDRLILVQDDAPIDTAAAQVPMMARSTMPEEEDPAVVSFEARRESAAADPMVRCPRCGKRIHMYDVRCEHCGLHFDGEAWEFSPSTLHPARPSFFGMPRWLVPLVVIAVLSGFVASIL
jgi:DNA-directed RNA polymerase subunit RPC12/RpoP